MAGITKDFLGGRVLHGVDFTLHRGEVHALVGQNGAGKSTLIKILGGAFNDYGGSVEIDGAHVSLRDPRQAKASGIALIYQDFTLVPHFSVAENIALGREPVGRLAGTINHSRLRGDAVASAAALDIDLPLATPVRELGVASQQLTEIVKAVSRNARILVMDEPTARLSARERSRLFAIIRDLVRKGVGIVYISHFLEEIFSIADRVTVLRDGRVVSRSAVKALTIPRLTELMTNSKLRGAIVRRNHAARLENQGLSLRDFGVPGRVGPITLEIAPGEVVGLAGLVGSGRTSLARAMVGLGPRTSGTLAAPTWVGRPRHPADAAAAGILLVSEDRKREGVIGVRSIAENIAIAALRRRLSRLGIIRGGARRELVTAMIGRLGIVPPNPTAVAANLSGGNQQKLVFARAIAAGARFLILDQPTAGVDIGAKADLYEHVNQLTRDGVGILLISDELDELLSLSDRIAIFLRGRIIGIAPAASFDRASLLEAITSGIPAK